MTVVAVVVVPVGVARIEVEVVGVVRVVRVLRGRPIVAVATSVVEVAVPAIARSGQLTPSLRWQSADTDGGRNSLHDVEGKPSPIL